MVDKKSPEMIKQRKLLRKSTYIILFGVLIGAALTVLVVKQSPSIKERYKELPQINTPLVRDLIALKQSKLAESKVYIPLAGPISSGDILSFKISVLRPVFVGLLVSVNQQKPTFEFYTRLPPGEGRKIERQGVRYSYTVPEVIKSLKFCAVYAENKKELKKLSAQLDLVWSKLPNTSCLALM